MKKENMLEKIYEVIADKTVGFWLIFKSDRLKNKKLAKYINWFEVSNHDMIDDFNCIVDWELKTNNHWYLNMNSIIGHPVMIWDVLDWIEKLLPSEIGSHWHEVICLWKDKRKPIDDQSIEFITYIYNLLKKWKNVKYVE